MGRRLRYVIDGLEFRTKQAAVEHVRAILYGHEFEQPIVGPAFSFLMDLLGRHKSAGQKAGCGVAVIFTRANPLFPNNRGFWLRRTDGTETDFSFWECLSPSSRDDCVRQAARLEIADQVIRFRDTVFARSDGKITCELTGERIGVGESHVDHVPPDTFAAIWERFLDEHGLISDDIDLTESRDGDIGQRIADPELAAAWQQFHWDSATLRVVSRWGNLSVAKRAARVQ